MSTPPRRVVRRESLSVVEREALFGWGDDVFDAAGLGLKWRQADLHLVTLAGDQAVGHCGLLRHTVRVGDQPLEVGGINGVITIPAARGKGYAVEMLRAAKAIFNEWRVAFGLLFCNARLEGFYDAQGWRPVRAPVTIDQPHGCLTAPMSAMYLPVARDLWPEGLVDLQSLPW